MVKSMTGYGNAEESYGEERFSVEIKSVNSRYLDIHFNLPAPYRKFEEEMRKLIAGTIRRGKVAVTVIANGSGLTKKELRTDWTLLKRYLEESERMQEFGPFDSSRILEYFLFHPDIVTVNETIEMTAKAQAVFMKAVEEAVFKLSDMRRSEGHLLESDLQMRLNKVQAYCSELKDRLPVVNAAYRERIVTRMRELIGTVDEDRLLTEVAVFAEKSDIAEELTRLDAHYQQFRMTLQESDVIGRKLDFILQEMNREINTIGAKGSDVEVSRLVVEIKSQLEKLKEQVQNIE